MVEVDNDRLIALIEAFKVAYPDIDPYIIWVYSMDYVLNEQGIYGDENLWHESYEKQKVKLKSMLEYNKKQFKIINLLYIIKWNLLNINKLRW